MAVRYVQLAWNATTLGAKFARYELERSEDNGTTFATIASITTESVTSFRDYEPRRTMNLRYRMRVVRIDEAPSLYSTLTSTVAVPPGTRWAIVSNEDPTVNVEVDVENDNVTALDYTFPTNEAEYQVSGRDGSIVLRGLERRGDRFTLKVLGIYEANRPGRVEFDTLLALARRTDLSYLAVLEPEGARWFAALTLESGRQSANRGIYEKPLLVREVTFTPSTPDAAP